MKLKMVFAAIMVIFFVISCSGNRLNGTWECACCGEEVLKFSGKKVAVSYDDEIWMEGTYSISGDSIEVIDSDGDINVVSFSRTDNTITIDGERYIRRK